MRIGQVAPPLGAQAGVGPCTGKRLGTDRSVLGSRHSHPSLGQQCQRAAYRPSCAERTGLQAARDLHGLVPAMMLLPRCVSALLLR